jgi:DNA replication protein
MTYRVAYSAAQPGTFTHLPATYVSQVVRQVSDLDELKVTLVLFFLLSRARDYPAYVTRADIVVRAAAMLGLDEAACTTAVGAAVRRGVFLEADVMLEGKKTIAYFANVEADVEVIAQMVAADDTSTSVGRPKSANIFELYEQNIGIITPLIAEELRDAQKTYPAEWIEEAFREAVKGHKQNWKYVSRILERWSTEGRGSGAHRQSPGADDPDKYIRGKYGRVVRR